MDRRRRGRGLYIVLIATADALHDEGDRVHNCVANYISDVFRGEAYFYHVSKDDRRIAAVQLGQTTRRYLIEEIKGICNTDVPLEVLSAVRHWIAQKELPEIGANH